MMGRQDRDQGQLFYEFQPADVIPKIPFVVLIGAFALPEYLLMILMFVSGMCLLGGQVGLNALAGTIYPTFVRSTGAGWALGIGRIGSILGPVIGGVLIGMKLSTPTLFICAAIPAGCAGALLALRRAVLMTKTTRESEREMRESEVPDRQFGAESVVPAAG